MRAQRRMNVTESRYRLAGLLAAAEKGQSTIITRHGRPIAMLMPVAAHGAAVRQQSLLPLRGSGRGLWGKDSTQTLRRLRSE